MSRSIFLHSAKGTDSKADYYSHLTKYLLETQNNVQICTEHRVYDSCLQHQDTYSDDIIVVIIDIVRCPHEAIPFLKGISYGELTHKIRIILISSLLTWCGNSSQTVLYSLENNGLKFRIPIHAYTETLQLENSFYALSSATCEVVVIGKGLIYGQRGFDFHFFMQSLLYDEHVLPLMTPSDDVVPAIHMDDFCEIINFAASSESIPVYIPAIDSCLDPLHLIISNIAKELDVPELSYSEMDRALEFAVDNPEIMSLFHCKLKFPEHSTIDIQWKFQSGLSEGNIPAVVREYRALNNLSPCRLMVVGMPLIGKTALSQIISQK